MPFTFLTCLLSLLLFSACQPTSPINAMTNPLSTIQITQEPNFKLATDATGKFNPDVLKSQFSCSEVALQSTALGYLTPNEPMVVCTYGAMQTREHPVSPDWLQLSNRFLSYSAVKYIVQEKSALKSLDTLADFKARYAPVDSPEEALSFVLATTFNVTILTAKTLQNMPSFEVIPQYFKINLPRTEATQVTASDNGYVVSHIFANASLSTFINCGASLVDYSVSKTGDIKELRRQSLFENGPCPAVD